MLQETGRLADGRVELQWKWSGGRRMTPRYASQLSRALLKNAFECAWLDHGTRMLEPRFDHIRAAVLGEPRSGYFTLLNKADPDSVKVSLKYHLLPHEGETSRMVVVGDYYGVFVATDSRLLAPPEDLPEGIANLITFTAADSRAA
jgi:hypothetical protein